MRAGRHVARAGVYRARPPVDDADLAVMKRLDQLYTERPFYGSRRMVLQLRQEGHEINRKRVQRPMRRMGIVALGPKPNTEKPAPGHKIYPSLLRDLKIEPPNHVWCADITYLPIGDGFLYRVAVMDWASRAVLSWRLSNTMDAAFCVAALDDALARHGRPEIFDTDQGSRFTGRDFTGRLEQSGVRISMDGHGHWMDDVFIERLWRSLEHEDVYSKAYADGREARAGIAGLDRVLQRGALSPSAREPDTHAGVARRHDDRGCIGRAGCGDDGQRCRGDHIPTAAADNALFGCMIGRLTSGRSPIIPAVETLDRWPARMRAAARAA